MNSRVRGETKGTFYIQRTAEGKIQDYCSLSEGIGPAGETACEETSDGFVLTYGGLSAVGVMREETLLVWTGLENPEALEEAAQHLREAKPVSTRRFDSESQGK